MEKPLVILFVVAHGLRVDKAVIAWIESHGVSGWFSLPLYFVLLLIAALFVTMVIEFFTWIFSDWKQDGGKVSAVISLVSGVASLIILPVLLAPVAIFCGTFSAIQGNRAGWLGLVLGTVGLAGMLLLIGLASHAA